MNQFRDIKTMNLKNLFTKKSKTIELDLSKDEYKKLVELVFVGDWVLTGHIEGKDPYDSVRNKIFAYAKDMGMAKQIEYDDALCGYFETVQFETKMLKKIDRFVKDAINE